MVLGSAVGRLFVEECYPRLLSEIDNRWGDERDAKSQTAARRRIYGARSKEMLAFSREMQLI